MDDIDKDIDNLEQKEDKDKPFVHKFFWFSMLSEHEFQDLLEYTALKLCNQAKCSLVEIVDEKKLGAKGEVIKIAYFIVAEGKKQKLMLLMELCKAWHIGIRYINDKQDRQLNKR